VKHLPWLYLAPALGAVGLFYLYPLVQTGVFSVFDLEFSTRIRPELWVGLEHFRIALSDTRFVSALGFTLVFSFFALALDLVLGTILALAAMHVHQKLRGLVRSFILIPWAIPPVIQGTMWRWILNGEAGPVGDILVRSGLVAQSPLFLAQTVSATISLIFVFSWRGASMATFFLLSGLSSLPLEVFDSARIDGAGKLRTFFSINLPLMIPTVIVALLYRSMDALRVFDVVYALTGGGPGTSTDTISSFAYNAFFRYSQFGQAAAYSVIMFGLALLVGIPLIFSTQGRLGRGVAGE